MNKNESMLSACGERSCADLWRERAAEMSACAGMIRDRQRMRAALDEVNRLLAQYGQVVRKPDPAQLSLFFRLRDMLLTQSRVLTAMCDYADRGGSRGSGLYSCADGQLPWEGLPDLFRFWLDEGGLNGMIQETDGSGCAWRPVRPIPQMDYFFENQWKRFRERESL